MVRQLSEMTKEAKPTPFHHMLAKLASEDRLLRLYTQNVDGLDTSMDHLNTTVPLNRKGPWPKTIQLHGGLQKMVCSKCNDMSDLAPDLFDGPTPPLCKPCEDTDNARTEHAGKRSHGIGRLRPRMVLYNEHNPDDEAIGAVVKSDLRTRPDAIIVVGTTLKIPGVKRIVKEMCGVVRGRRDGLTVWINTHEPPVSKDYEWDLIVRGPCDHVAKQAAAHIWEAPRPETVTKEEIEKIEASQSVEVQAPTVPQSAAEKLLDAEKSMPTPASSRSSSILPLTLGKSKKILLIGKKSVQKGAPKPKVKRAPKPKAPTAKKGKKESASSTIGKLSFSLSKGDSIDVKRPKSIKTSEPLSPIDNADKENSTPPADIDSNLQTPLRESSVSDTKPLSPVSDTSRRRPSKSSIEFILN
jgi:NAD+-dependent protein deacetylase SIR2